MYNRCILKDGREIKYVKCKIRYCGFVFTSAGDKRGKRTLQKEEIKLEELRVIEDQEIAKLVDQEVAHGLKVVTDGEFRRRWWHLDWLKEFDGFTTKHLEKNTMG